MDDHGLGPMDYKSMGLAQWIKIYGLGPMGFPTMVRPGGLAESGPIRGPPFVDLKAYNALGLYLQQDHLILYPLFMKLKLSTECYQRIPRDNILSELQIEN